jgi:hypothetical protein
MQDLCILGNNVCIYTYHCLNELSFTLQNIERGKTLSQQTDFQMPSDTCCTGSPQFVPEDQTKITENSSALNSMRYDGKRVRQQNTRRGNTDD